MIAEEFVAKVIQIFLEFSGKSSLSDLLRVNCVAADGPVTQIFGQTFVVHELIFNSGILFGKTLTNKRRNYCFVFQQRKINYINKSDS